MNSLIVIVCKDTTSFGKNVAHPPLFSYFCIKIQIMSKYLLARYIWEVSTIHRARRITLKEINERWRDSPYYDGKDIPRRTWDYHRKEIEMLFGVSIECDKHDNTYRIESDSGFRNDELKQWLIHSFSMTNVIREARDLEIGRAHV